MPTLLPHKIIPGVVPKYRQLLDILRNQVISGEIPPGGQIPTEDALIERYGISRGTVRKAIDQLEAEKLIRKEHGVGSFALAEHPNAVPFFFSEEFLVELYGKKRVSFEDLAKEIVPAALDTAERLHVRPGEGLIHIARRQLLDGKIVCYTERDIPEELCPSLMNMDLRDQPLHDVLVFVSEIPLLRAEIEIEARLANPEEAVLLGVDRQTPLIAIRRMTYTAPNRPAVWFQGLFRQRFMLDVRVDE
jgi:GntR family transcriptional regulator